MKKFLNDSLNFVDEMLEGIYKAHSAVTYTADDLEMQIGTNHFGHFLLGNLLIEHGDPALRHFNLWKHRRRVLRRAVLENAQELANRGVTPIPPRFDLADSGAPRPNFDGCLLFEG